MPNRREARTRACSIRVCRFPASSFCIMSAARFIDLFSHGLRRSLDRGPKYTPKPAVVAAELGNLSGAIGAAVMAREEAII